jgi:hypothetical protein
MASIACECSKTPSKDKPNQNTVVHSIMNPHLPKVLSSWYIKVIPLPCRRSEQKCDFRRMFIYKPLKKGKEGIEHLLFGDEPNHEDSQGMIEKHNGIVSRSLRRQEYEPGQSNSYH